MHANPQETIYNKIGVGYNRTRAADPYIAGRLAGLLDLQHGKEYLDIGCGTGNYTIYLAEQGYSFIGVDPSAVMLDEARVKSELVQWMDGSAAEIPLSEAGVDGAIATLTIHHWPDIAEGFREAHRVLKTGGRFVIFSFTKEQETGYWLNHFFPKMMRKTFQKAVTLEAVKEAAEQTGFELLLTEKYFVREDLQDLFGYAGKHNPRMYLDPEIRKGISAFALLSDAEETALGLAALEASIADGSFAAIKTRYDNDMGDYLFIVLRKP